ncbi:MAG: cadmium-translocating P-type ATPase [Rhodospirillales bacterium]|nr:cadmium-translocating P-type ATPase [Rhodospirillales bacterium]
MKAACLHCGGPLSAATAEEFCCAGCRAAHALVKGLGLDDYYRRRALDPHQPLLKPNTGAPAIHDFSAYALTEADGSQTLHLMVEGLHCAACVWLIESVLARQKGVVRARLNMTTRRLVLTWRPGEARPEALVGAVQALGYRLAPYDPAKLAGAQSAEERALLKAMAVAGFAAGNIMLLSVSVWAGHDQGMGEATRGLMHWLSALIALPAIAYAGRPFFRSAFLALRAGRTNMDVPISIGVTLTALMSLAETVRGGPHAYFDSAVTLLFFLLIGRYLDGRARGRARGAAEHLLALAARPVSVLGDEGSVHACPPERVRPGDRVLVAMGERIGIDGVVEEGRSEIDTSLVTGESAPRPVEPGQPVFAGTLNLGAALRLRATATAQNTLLAEIVRLMEAAEQGRARFTALADRVARLYAPVVHTAALLTFLGWVFLGGLDWRLALLNAVAVLIVTCPCALALAVPAVQVIAAGRLLKRGILVKSPTALERLASADRVVLDKTGTLTLGHPVLKAGDGSAGDLAQAARLAQTSRHPLARALAKAAPGAVPLSGVTEFPGLGLEGAGLRLGRRDWVAPDLDAPAALGPELWLGRPGKPPLRFTFADPLRPDAPQAVAALAARGLVVELLSGDRPETVAEAARETGIAAWRAGQSPTDKAQRLADLKAQGHRPLMVGDGLNDAPALAGAHVSISPASAADVSQTAADLVFQGERLDAVVEALDVAARADRLIRENLAAALVYNVLAVPLAVAGWLTPLLAAIAMSSSSLIVILNALRLARDGRATGAR